MAQDGDWTPREKLLIARIKQLEEAWCRFQGYTRRGNGHGCWLIPDEHLRAVDRAFFGDGKEPWET